MAPKRYQVSNSQRVADEFRALLELARQQGRLDAVRQATGKILSALALVPGEFGESKGELPVSKAVLRRGFIEPLTVEDAVFEDELRVFTKSFRLWRPGRPDRPG